MDGSIDGMGIVHTMHRNDSMPPHHTTPCATSQHARRLERPELRDDILTQVRSVNVMHASTSITLYMRMDRSIRRIPIPISVCTCKVRDGFRLHRAIDAAVVPSLLVEANRHLDMLKSMAGGPTQRSGAAAARASSSFWAPDPWMVAQGQGGQEQQEEERVVGEGWPWERDRDAGDGSGGGDGGSDQGGKKG